MDIGTDMVSNMLGDDIYFISAYIFDANCDEPQFFNKCLESCFQIHTKARKRSAQARFSLCDYRQLGNQSITSF